MFSTLQYSSYSWTTFIIFYSVKSRMATGYNSDGSEVPIYDLGWAAPAAQMYSTVNDLLKVALL